MGWKQKFVVLETHQICLNTNYRVSLFFEIFFKNIYHFNLNGK